MTLLRASACLLSFSTIALCQNVSYSPSIQKIITNAAADGIVLTSLPFASDAFASIEAIQIPLNATPSNISTNTRIDTHAHVVPDWYRALVPNTAGQSTPEWDIQSHLNFMAAYDVGHDIVSISSPGSAVFLGNKAFSVGLARLLNEWIAALVRTYPDILSFYAVIPLPYVDAAIKEAEYARTHLGAIGSGLLSNHEGKYLGNPLFKPFFEFLESRDTDFEVIFVHPTVPVLDLNGTFISGNPTTYAPGVVEFYFDNARTFMDLTLSQTIFNFTKIRYHLPHEGGSFPSIEDRFFALSLALEAPSKEIYNTRFWYDSAGHVFHDQVKGLLGYGVPTSQLVFGSDHPYYFSPLEYAQSLTAILDADFVTAADKQHLFRQNAEQMYGKTF